jgi:hypothetical protein
VRGKQDESFTRWGSCPASLKVHQCTGGLTRLTWSFLHGNPICSHFAPSFVHDINNGLHEATFFRLFLHFPLYTLQIIRIRSTMPMFPLLLTTNASKLRHSTALQLGTHLCPLPPPPTPSTLPLLSNIIPRDNTTQSHQLNAHGSGAQLRTPQPSPQISNDCQ